MIDYRARARKHFDAATALIAAGDDESLLYGCLRLRFAIEALAHGQVQLYRGDLDPEVLADWRANRVLKELAELDPAADGDVSIEIGGSEDEPGIRFTDHRITAKWISRAYPALGNFLHERTLVDLEKRGEADQGVVRRKAVEVADEVSRVLNSTGWNFQIAFTTDIPCKCGEAMVLRAGGRQRRARTHCAACNTSHQVEIEWQPSGGLRARIAKSSAGGRP